MAGNKDYFAPPEQDFFAPPPEAVAKKSPDRLAAFGQGLAQGGTLGYANEIQAKTAPAVESVLDLLGGGQIAKGDKALKDAGISGGEDTYEQRLSENQSRDKELKDSGYYTGGQLTGALATAAVPGKIAGGLAKLAPSAVARALAPAASLSGRVAQGATAAGLEGFARNPEEGETRKGNALISSLLGGAGATVGKFFGKKGAREGAESLAESAERQALRTAGAQKPQMRKLMEKGKTRDVGRFIIDNDLLDDTMDGAQKIKGDAGSTIGQILKDVDAAGPPLVRKDVADQLRQEIRQNKGLSKAIGGNKIVERLLSDVDEFSSKSPVISAEDLRGFRGSLDDKINYVRSPLSGQEPAMEGGYKSMRGKVNSILNDLVDSRGRGGDFKPANKRFGMAADAEKLGANKAAQEGNDFFSLTDKMAAGVGGGAGLAAGGVEGLPAALAAALASKGIRTYGPKASTKALDYAGKGLEKFSRLTPLDEVDPYLAGIAAEKLRELRSK